MQISEIHRQNELAISFELFPPRKPEGETTLFEKTVPGLIELGPAFMTCTYGAGGSTQDKTLQIIGHIQRETSADTAAHLTCVGSSRDDIARFLEEAKSLNVDNIVALRGDPPENEPDFKPHPDGFAYASDLIAFIKEHSDFGIIAAGYPEGHPECPDKAADWSRVKDKVDAGADAVITQLFYDVDDFFAFDDYLKNKLKINVPIVPGVLPILSTKQIRRFCGMCGAKLPDWLESRLDELAEDNDSCRKFGIDLASEMCQKMLDYGVPGIHFYTLNRIQSTRCVMENLNLLPAA